MLLIILPLTISLALTLQPVQNFVAYHITRITSEKLGSKVALSRVSFSMLNRFVLHDFLVEDSTADTLLYASQLRIRVSHLSLFEGEVVVGSAEITDGEIRLREMASGYLNIKEIVDKLTNEEREQPSDFLTSINSVKVSNIDFSLERLKEMNPEYGINFSDIRMHIDEGEVCNFSTQSGVTRMSINDFKGREQSGFEVEQFRGELTIKIGELLLSELYIETPSSQLNLSEVTLKGSSWEDFSQFVNLVDIDVSLNNSTLSTGDVAYFVPAFRNTDLTVEQLSLSAAGRVDDLSAKVKRLSFGSSSSLRGDLTVVGGDRLPTAKFDFKLHSISSNAKDINLLATEVGLSPLKGSARSIVANLGAIDISAAGRGTIKQMQIDTLQLKSSIGALSYGGELQDIGANIGCRGVVKSHNFDLGRALGNSKLGGVNLSSNVTFRSGHGGVDASLQSYVSSIYYNNNNYTALNVSTLYQGQRLSCRVVSEDEKLNFDLESHMLFAGEESEYDLTLRLDDADIYALAINKRDSISRLSGVVKLQMRGDDIDNLAGDVSLSNMNYIYGDNSIYTPSIEIKALNGDQSKSLSLESDFVDLTYRSKSSYKDLLVYLKEALQTYIPILYDDSAERKEHEEMTFANNYSSVNVTFKEVSPLCEAVFSGFNIANNSKFNLYVNPYSGSLILNATSDFVELRKFAATGININANNNRDSLTMFATTTDILYGSTLLPPLTLTGGARNNKLGILAEFRDTVENNSAKLNLRANFNEQHDATITVLPSNIILGEERWIISADDIVSRGATFEIDNFAISNGEQKLSLNGTISSSESDTLSLKLNHYDIGMLTSVISDMGYFVDGSSSGEVRVSALLSAPRIVADVELDDVDVNSIPSPPLRLQAVWNSDQNRAGLFVTNRQSRDTVVTGYYAPSSMRYYARLKVDSLNMGLIDPLLSTTIASTRGYANADVTINGQHRDASLHGHLDIYDMSTKVLFTQVEYSLPSARIEIEDNIFSSRAQEVFDKDGNRGLLTLIMSLDHLSNVTYRLRMVPENMLVLNTTLKDNELFYGTLYATGVATIEGDKRGVSMDITATSQPASQFFMPLNSKSTVAKTDFITFVQADVEHEENPSINARREFLNERERRYNAQAGTQLNINMALHATPDLDFQLVIDPVVGDIIRAKGEGRLNLAIAPQDNTFEMYGDYNITEGNYLFTLLNPISKRFEIDSGSSIQWTGDPIDPMLNIDAVYKVKTSLDPLISGVSSDDDGSSSRAVPVDCIIHLGDRLTQPSVDFSIEVPTADTEQQTIIANTLIDQETISQQFFYLMFANSFISTSSSIGSNDLGSSTTASTGFELLTNQLSNWLSSTNYNVVIRYRPESTLTSDEVDLGFSRGLINNRLLIEVEGNYLADNKASIDDSNLSNFMGEAYITWLIDKAGAIQLKGFTQTIDRYDENQGLQETGIGIYYSESFDKFKDLKRKIADRFRSKK